MIKFQILCQKYHIILAASPFHIYFFIMVTHLAKLPVIDAHGCHGSAAHKGAGARQSSTGGNGAITDQLHATARFQPKVVHNTLVATQEIVVPLGTRLVNSNVGCLAFIRTVTATLHLFCMLGCTCSKILGSGTCCLVSYMNQYVQSHAALQTATYKSLIVHRQSG